MKRHELLLPLFLAGASALPVAAHAGAIAGLVLNSSPSAGSVVPLVSAGPYANGLSPGSPSIGSVNFANGAALSACAVTPDGTKAFISGFEPYVQVAHLVTSPPTASSQIPLANPVDDLSVTPNGNFLVVGDNQGNLSTFNVATGASVSQSLPEQSSVISVNACDDNAHVAVTLAATQNGNDGHFGTVGISSQGALVSLYSSAGGILTQTTGGGPPPSGLAQNPIFNTYCVPGTHGNILLELDGDGGVGQVGTIGFNPFKAVGGANVPSGKSPESAAFSSNGATLYIVEIGTSSQVQAFGVNIGNAQTTGIFTNNGNPLWTTVLASSPVTSTPYGNKLIAVSSDGAKLYVPGQGGVNVLNAQTGALTYESASSLNYGSAVCLIPAKSTTVAPPVSSCGPYQSCQP